MVAWQLALGAAAVDAGVCCPDLPPPHENGLHMKLWLLSKGNLHPMANQCGMWRPGSLSRSTLAPEGWGIS